MSGGAFSLDGPAVSGFNTDISLTDPSLPRTLTPRLSRAVTPRARTRTITPKVPLNGIQSPQATNGAAQEDAAPGQTSSGVSSGETTASHETETDEQHDSEGEESQEDLMDLATNRVSGLRMRSVTCFFSGPLCKWSRLDCGG